MSLNESPWDAIRKAQKKEVLIRAELEKSYRRLQRTFYVYMAIVIIVGVVIVGRLLMPLLR